MTLIPSNPRPRPGVTDEYRRAIANAFRALPEEPHENTGLVSGWAGRHGWNPAEIDLDLVGDVLSAVCLELTLLLIEDTPAEAEVSERLPEGWPPHHKDVWRIADGRVVTTYRTGNRTLANERPDDIPFTVTQLGFIGAELLCRPVDAEAVTR